MSRSYDTKQEIIDKFSKLGFQEYDVPQIATYEHCAGFLQKKYKDEIGIKYFIEIKIYDFSFSDKVPENFVIEFAGQYYQKDTHNAINMDFIGWELEDVEKFLNTLFENKMLEHYEKWVEA